MTTDNIFQAEGTTEQKPEQAPQDKAESALLQALVGEKQKYKSVEELAKAYTNADEFIERLKEENRQLREQAASAKTIDDVLSRLNKPAEPHEHTASASSLTVEEVTALVERTVTGRETAKSKRDNLVKADQLMKEKFGEKALEKFNAKASTPALKNVYMELAGQDPQHFMSLFSEPLHQSAAMDMGSSTSNLQPSTASANTEWSKEWVSKLRKENPGKYWSAEFQYELQNRVIKNPNPFLNG